MWFLFLLLASAGVANGAVKFYFFSREYPTSKLLLNNTNLGVVNGNHPVKFIVHGWGENSERAYYTDMTDAYLIRGDYNVIQVDWQEEAAVPYLTAATNTKEVGSLIGQLITTMANTYGINPNSVHIIGHSLGGHVAGFAGKSVQELLRTHIHKISALDPAGPAFEGKPDSEKLHILDAKMVDVTHTDAKFFGYNEPIGTVDFYANGGHRPQPGCALFSPQLLQMDPALIAFCSHTRSYHYFIESINSQGMVATECKTYTDFLADKCADNQKIVYGEDVPLEARGVFYFNTNAEKPYAIK